MELSELNAALHGAVDKRVEAVRKASEIAAQNVLLAEYKNRIFVEGKDSTGGKIGTYSTKPMYGTKQAAVRKGAIKGIGKNGDTKFTNGKPHKSMYLPNGYAGFRAAQGRQTGFVDLNLSSSLFRAVQLYKQGDTTVIAIADIKESKKFRGNEKHFSKNIASLIPSEKELYQESIIELTKQELG